MIPLVKGLALLQLGDRQQAAQEVADAKQLLGASEQQAAAEGQQHVGLQQVQQMYARVSAHLPC